MGVYVYIYIYLNVRKSEKNLCIGTPIRFDALEKSFVIFFFFKCVDELFLSPENEKSIYVVAMGSAHFMSGWSISYTKKSTNIYSDAKFR